MDGEHGYDSNDERRGNQSKPEPNSVHGSGFPWIIQENACHSFNR